jgi:hypothetical protein
VRCLGILAAVATVLLLVLLLLQAMLDGKERTMQQSCICHLQLHCGMG